MASAVATRLAPDLKGVISRRAKGWLHEFINGSAAMKRKAIALVEAATWQNVARLITRRIISRCSCVNQVLHFGTWRFS
jgi:hypothetical protein